MVATTLLNIQLKPDSYGFQSMKMAYGCTAKSCGFLVINVNCLILINERKILLKLLDEVY